MEENFQSKMNEMDKNIKASEESKAEQNGSRASESFFLRYEEGS